MLINFEQLNTVRQTHKTETIALAGGVFDLIHPGHVDLFKKMKATADVGVVAVSSDERVRQRKGSLRPVQSQSIRQEMVDAIKYVDYTLVAPDPTREDVLRDQVMRALRPDVFLSSDESWLDRFDLFDELGIDFRLVQRYSEDISTSLTIKAILDGHSAQ